jgi:uncharacterized membrane protein (TIGR02234 family)
MRDRAEFALTLLVQVVAAGAAALIATRSWQQVAVGRPRPLADVVVPLSGRAIDAAPTAFALVALAGVVAVLATRGWVRRAVGTVIGLSGVGLAWRSGTALSHLSARRGLDLARAHRAGLDVGGVESVAVRVHPLWGWLSLFAGVAVVAVGVIIAVRGAVWATMSARYERADAHPDPDAAARARARADATMWTALDRGDDPTQ